MKIHTHLSAFYELVGTMGFEEGDTETVYLWLFPFSLAGKEKEWLKSHPKLSLKSWNDVEEKFLHRFFPISRYINAKSGISTFRQGWDEAFCGVWMKNYGVWMLSHLYTYMARGCWLIGSLQGWILVIEECR